MNNRLKVLFWASIAVSLVLVLLFETNVLLPGALADEVSVQFVVVTLLELLTICCIPLAVRMFRFKKIRGDIKNGHYMKWAFLISMIFIYPSESRMKSETTIEE